MNESHSTADELWQYVDGSLTADARQVVQRHLETCTDCRDRLRLAGRIDTALRTARNTGTDPVFTDRIMARVAGAAATSGAVIRLGAFVAYGTSAAIVMGTIVGVSLFTGGGSAPSDSWAGLPGKDILADVLRTFAGFLGWAVGKLSALPSISISGRMVSVALVAGVTMALLAILDKFFLLLFSDRGRHAR